MVDDMKDFFSTSVFLKGCNPSFITLTPKIADVKFVFDFHPINLIGCQSNIVAKILANPLSIC